jgi:hypothetical protein
MTGEQLIAEGRRLARPCVYLCTSGDHFAAIWGGKGVVPGGDGPYRHWLSVACSYIPGGEAKPSGCLSIYTDEDDCDSGIVALDDSLTLPEWAEGLRLYAHPGSSLPPIDAVFKFGSREVAEWLAANEWQPAWGHNDNFPDSAPVALYEREYQKQLPLYSGGAHAVLGGWHMPWPDGDWDELVDKRLIVWTFAESEPWVEVWKDEGSFHVIQRIT